MSRRDRRQSVVSNRIYRDGLCRVLVRQMAAGTQETETGRGLQGQTLETTERGGGRERDREREREREGGRGRERGGERERERVGKRDRER